MCRRILTVGMCCGILLSIACGGQGPAMQSSTYIPVKGSAWRLALTDVNGDGVNDMVYGAYDGAVRCVDLNSGKVLWEASTNSFPFNIAAEDIDGDGAPEIYAAAADGGLYAFNARGEQQWVFRSKTPLYNVGVGDIQPGGTKEIACGGIDRFVYVLSSDGKQLAKSDEFERLVFRLEVADLDNDGADEIFAVDNRVYADVWEYEDGTFQRKHRNRMTVPEEYVNWENPSGSFYTYGLTSGDLDNDGTLELVGGDAYQNKQSVMAMDLNGKGRWLTPRLTQTYWENNTYREFYSTAFVRVGEVNVGSPGKEVMVVKGGMVEMLSSTGESMGVASSHLGFTDLVIDGTTLYLGSTPNGDETIYRIDLTGDWITQVRNLERQGLVKEIGESIATIWEQVQAYQGEEPKAPNSIMLHQLGARPTPEGIEKYKQDLAFWKQEFPYEMYSYPVSYKVMEPTPPLDPDGIPWSQSRWNTDALNGTMTLEEIYEGAKFYETQKIPFKAYIGHSCMPFITLETAQKLLDIAPNTLIGWRSAEDEDPVRWPRYLKHWFGPLMDMTWKSAQATGIEKFADTLNKGVWWISAPARDIVFPEMFKGMRSEILYGSTEDSNSRTPEINLLGRSGLWMAGLLKKWQVSCIHDLYSFNRWQQWEYPKHGHTFLRLLMAHTVLGGNQFHYRSPLVNDGEWVQQAQESYRLFLHMMGKGLVFPPEREQMVGVSRIGIAMHDAPEKWITDAHNGHSPERWVDDDELHNAVLPHIGSLWGNTPTPEHALQKVLLEKERQFGYQAPATPYGAPMIVPASADLSQVPFVEEWWHTDGIYAWKEGGPKLTGMEAANAMQADFERAAAKLPFRATGHVFFHTLKLNDNTYRMYAIDPDWLDPEDRDVTLRVQLPGNVTITDVLSGESVAVNGSIAKFKVPAGAFRILDAVVK
jgi:lambda-carrageenase